MEGVEGAGGRWYGVMALGPAGVLGVVVVGLLPGQLELLNVLHVISGLGILFEFLELRRNTEEGEEGVVVGPPATVQLVLVPVVGVDPKVSWWIGERSMHGVRGEGGREEPHDDD